MSSSYLTQVEWFIGDERKKLKYSVPKQFVSIYLHKIYSYISNVNVKSYNIYIVIAAHAACRNTKYKHMFMHMLAVFLFLFILDDKCQTSCIFMDRYICVCCALRTVHADITDFLYMKIYTHNFSYQNKNIFILEYFYAKFGKFLRKNIERSTNVISNSESIVAFWIWDKYTRLGAWIRG